MTQRTLSVCNTKKVTALSVDILAERLAKMLEIYPDSWVVVGQDELLFYRVINNGGDAEYLAQLCFD